MGILACLRETQEWGMAQRMKFNKAGLLAVVLILSTGLARVAQADDESDRDAIDMSGAKTTDFIKSRTYIGVVGISSTIDQWGDFTGNNSVQYGPVTFQTSPVTEFTNPEVDLIPTIQRNFGFGALVGHREGPWAAEVSYWRSDHTASSYSNGPSGPTTFNTPARLEAFNIDLKRYFFTQLPTQPFVSVGFTFPWLWMRQGSYILDYHNPPNPATGQYNIIGINDETISGFGLNVGAGLEIYLGNGFSLIGGAYESWIGFDQNNGATKVPLNSIYFDGNPSDRGSFAGNGLNLYVGTTVGFE